jgi:hypothetical protein
MWCRLDTASRAPLGGGEWVFHAGIRTFARLWGRRPIITGDGFDDLIWGLFCQVAG